MSVVPRYFRRDDITFDGSQNSFTIGSIPLQTTVQVAIRSGSATKFILQSELTVVGQSCTLNYTPSNGDVAAVSYWSASPVTIATVLGSRDPYFSSVVSLLHLDGANGSTTITDQISARTWNTDAGAGGAGGATLTTTGPKFGNAALSVTGTDNTSQQYITSDSSNAFAFGAGDFTIEGWIYMTAFTTTGGGVSIIYDGRPHATNGPYPVIAINQSGGLLYNSNGTDLFNPTTGALLSLNTWTHFAISRVSGNVYGFLGGTKVAGSNVADSTIYATSAARFGGSQWTNTGTGSWPFNGRMDDLRVTKGVGRYNVNFTPQNYAFQNA